MKKNGFTLIELLSVIVIISITFLIVIPSINFIMGIGEKKEIELIEEKVLNAAKEYVNNYDSIFYKNFYKEGDTGFVYKSDLINVGLIDENEINQLNTFAGVKGELLKNDRIRYTVEYINVTNREYTNEELYIMLQNVIERMDKVEFSNITDASIADLKNTVKENKEAIENNKSLIDVNTTNINNCSTSVVNLTNKSNINNVFLKMYPIGSIYVSTNSTNPKDIFGGTWTQLKDRFLLGAGDIYTAGSTGGEATHKLTINEMPSHTHMSAFFEEGVTEQTERVNALIRESMNINTYLYRKTENKTVLETGGNSAHNNMPPYLTVYMWKRTA